MQGVAPAKDPVKFKAVSADPDPPTDSPPVNTEDSNDDDDNDDEGEESVSEMYWWETS